MNIENFCCAAAELQNKMTQTTKMSQIYYYRAFGEETREDFLADNFFNQAQERVKVNDIIIGYYPDDEDNTLICWLKVTSNFGGKVTVEPFIADAALKEYIDSITPPLEDIFYATYGETTYSEITDALDDRKTVICRKSINNEVYEAVLESSQNGFYQFTHGKVYLDGEKTESYLETFTVDTNDVWNTERANLQEKLVSGTNIKTVNGNSLVGSGNVDIYALPSQTGQAGKYLTTDGTNPSWNAISVEADSISINRNTSNELQTIGVINQNNTTTAIKNWTGTKAQYDAIVTKDANTQYTCTDSGEIYLGTNLIANKAGNRNIGEIIQSTIPLTDAGLHLLDGALISGSGAYAEFVDYIAGLVTDNPGLFTTEASWQTAITTYGVCGKFVYDSINNTLRLPKYSDKIWSGGGIANAKGNGKTLGLTNGDTLNGLVAKSATNSSVNYLGVSVGNYGDNIGTSVNSTVSSGYNMTFGVTTDPTKSGIITDFSTLTTALDGYWYIVVATSTKTSIEVDIDEIATDLNGKVDVDLTNCTKPHITETYVNGSSWYRVYSDGWCEQGGRTTGQTTTVNFLKPFRDVNYTVTEAPYGGSGGDYATRITDITSTSMKITLDMGGSAGAIGSTWFACGYIA